MRRRGAGLGLTTVLAMVLASVVCAQQDVQELQRRLLELEKKLQEQQVAFDQKVADLQKQIDEKSGEEEAALSDRINAVQKSVEKLDRLYRRPSIGQSTPSESIFSALQGGLIFTGLFRTRFEARRDNVDFNDTADGLDDSGLRLNGRFRLGFGAVLLERSPGGPQITALTEFQSVGTFANNSYVRLTSSTGVPVPLQFNILTEPFEAVGLYQGYLALSKVIDDTINVKVGRQEVVLGNELMLGNNSFEDGTVHDSLLFQWQPLEELVFTTLYSKEAASDGGLGNTRSDFDEDEMAVLYAEIKPDPSMSFDLYGIYFDARSAVNDIFVTGSTAFAFDGSYTPPILGHTWTVGGRAFFTDISVFDGVLTINAEAAYQSGEDSSLTAGTGTKRAIHGWVAEGLLDYHIDPTGEMKPIVTLGYYYAQGGEGLANGDIGFQPLFLNRHFERVTRLDREDLKHPYYPGGGRYGNMDQIPLTNMHIAKFAGSLLLSERVELGAGYVYAVTADDEGYGTGAFGHEVDVFSTYFYNDNVQFSANASVFFPGKTATSMSNLLFFNPLTAEHAQNQPSFALFVQALIQF